MLTDRQLNVLDKVIEKYVQLAKPIGSSLIAGEFGFSASPATIRTEMGELEKKGYLTHKHTSGGRVPTDKAYRHFVNKIVSRDLNPSDRNKEAIKQAISRSKPDPYDINKNVADTLSDLSESLVITNISERDDFYKRGLSALFEMPEFREFDRIFRFTSFFEEFDRMFDRMEQEFFGGPGLNQVLKNFNIFIGSENPLRSIKNETMICAQYDLPSEHRGSLTLIGPTRMDYKKNISLVKFAAEELNKLSKSI